MENTKILDREKMQKIETVRSNIETSIQEVLIRFNENSKAQAVQEHLKNRPKNFFKRIVWIVGGLPKYNKLKWIDRHYLRGKGIYLNFWEEFDQAGGGYDHWDSFLVRIDNQTFEVTLIDEKWKWLAETIDDIVKREMKSHNLITLISQEYLQTVDNG